MSCALLWNSNISEELKLQVKSMQALVGAFLDQDGAEYAKRFKEGFPAPRTISPLREQSE